MSNTYIKVVEGWDCGGVCAKVYRDDGRRLGIEIFEVIGNQEFRFKRAHKWADEKIRILTKYEVGI